MAKIGFIGTGIMGKPMAQNLQKAGHTLFFSEHFEKAPAELIGDNGIGLANPREVAQEAEFIIVMVPDTPQVEDVRCQGRHPVDHGRWLPERLRTRPAAVPGHGQEHHPRRRQR